jgi:Fe-S-cluster formation regulator IscX/YfhJ
MSKSDEPNRQADPRRLNAMISSTSLDMAEHREEVREACLRQGVFPLMMEHLPANDEDAIAASLRLVNEADLYVGLFAHRYGHIPRGHQISITEMEYRRALERGIPRLLFLMHDDHPIRISDVETGSAADKLAALKRQFSEQVVNFYKSPADLRGLLINSLARLKEDLAARSDGPTRRGPVSLHCVSDISQPPEPYIAHPYTLLPTRGLVGRQEELNQLTDWVVHPDRFDGARIFNVVAIGGMGKSALAWKWFNDIAPLEMKQLVGRMWWSFYESDATFENFIPCALAYVSGQDRDGLRNLSPPEREARLLAALDREPYLVVLDGLERVLNAYARMDAAQLADDDLDRRTGNALSGRHQLRKTTDPRAGAFLRRLAQVRASRVLVSTRLYPADLQTPTGQPLPGCRAHFLTGLADDDAVALWRALGVRGSRDGLLPLFRRFDNYPLLIRALAGEVARYRRAPGDFDRWRQSHPDFDPSRLELAQVKSHVLAFALVGLDEASRQVLHTIAGFRMPATYDTLVALLVGNNRTFAREQQLDAALTELEDRGLLGWDRAANRYDLHPVVRGVSWEGLSREARRGVYERLRAHFETIPTRTRRLEDLTPAVELYNSLIELEHFDDAHALFEDRLLHALMFSVGAIHERAALLERLFPDGDDSPPRLSGTWTQVRALNALALAYQFLGKQAQAARLLRRGVGILQSKWGCGGVGRGIAAIRTNLSDALRLCGELREAEAAACFALREGRADGDRSTEVRALILLGMVQAARGVRDCTVPFQHAWRVTERKQLWGELAWLSIRSAELALWVGDFTGAKAAADQAWGLVAHIDYDAHPIEAARLQGSAALFLGGADNLAVADERLQDALARVRRYTLYQEELPILVAMAELSRRRGEPGRAREFLDDLWEPAERGPYPLYHADALNVLAQVERDAGNRDAAVEAATKAYRLAWCDGPPFAYHWGLCEARELLAELGAPEPEMPPFDQSKFEPLPHVEIDPDFPALSENEE